MRLHYHRHDEELPPTVQLGGKARALAQLRAASLAIPAWGVISAEKEPGPAENSALNPIAQETTTAESTPAHNPAEDPTPPSTWQLTPTQAEQLIAWAHTLSPDTQHWAVRSSAQDEDGAEHSFAGQLDSFLFVPTAALPAHVEAVWRSGRSERLLAYRRARGLTALPSPPAVLVQTMIAAESAGVAFSADPVSGRRDWAVVAAVWGLGTALVGGEADADQFTVDRTGRILARTVAHKTFAHRAAPAIHLAAAPPTRIEPSSPTSPPGPPSSPAPGVQAVPLAPAQASQPALTDTEAIAVANLARAAAHFFGRPQDIEWAQAGGRLWLLQSRPITSLHLLADPAGVLNLWDNANIAESYNGVTTPLTFSFARRIYEAVYREFARLMGVTPARIAAHHDLFPQMLGLIRGRIYYNLISWYRLLALLPGYTFNRGFMEQMMGVREGLPAEAVARLPAPATGLARLREAWALLGSLGGLVRAHCALPRRIRHFYTRLAEALRPPEPPYADQRPDELVASYRELERRLLLQWDAPLVNDFFAMIFHGVLRKLTASWCSDTAGTLANDLLCAEGGLISAEPARRIRELARLVAAEPAAIERLCTGSLATIQGWLSVTPVFAEAYRAYLEKFGDRCLEELKLESITLHDDPLLLLRSVGHYARRLASHRAAPAEDGEVETALRQAAEARIATALHDRPLRRRVFTWVLAHTRARVRDRENLRFERTRLFGQVRRLFLELGRRLHAANRLADPRDIFYLTVEEALGFVDGTAVTTDLAALVALRQKEFATWRDGEAPADRFATRGAVPLGNPFRAAQPPVQPTGDRLLGTGCCPGVVRGRARVILDPRQAVLQPGEILVAPRTDPGWIMLFPSAAGLLVEYGSLLSHSAIVSREMGIPSIVAIAGLTAWARTGDVLELDGSTGVVCRLESVTK